MTLLSLDTAVLNTVTGTSPHNFGEQEGNCSATLKHNLRGKELVHISHSGDPSSRGAPAPVTANELTGLEMERNPACFSDVCVKLQSCLPRADLFYNARRADARVTDETKWGGINKSFIWM